MTDPRRTPTIGFELDGRPVEVDADAGSLLDALRDHLGERSVKDGCSPQGQCGCCTVLVDGAPRVSCVTPARRVAGRSVTTLAGLDPAVASAWADAFCATGASQCGFCTPGIIVRLEGLRTRSGDLTDRAAVDRALAAHLCRCTGWSTIVDAAAAVAAGAPDAAGSTHQARDLDAAGRRAGLEGRSPQTVGAHVALGEAGFADDTAPPDALVAVPGPDGSWAVGETLAEARAAAGKVQGRRTTVAAEPPVPVPEGDWALVLATSWVEPAYLETDASWCRPGGDPATPLANGGAFGGKVDSVAPAAARVLADRYGRPVRVLLSREDTVRLGPKRPPLAAGVRADGTGIVHVARTPGVADVITAAAPGLSVVEVDVAGPPTSLAPRGAGWVEAVALAAGARGAVGEVVHPDGGRATAELVDTPDGVVIRIGVAAGEVLDETVLRSYCLGAAHMGYGLVTSESLTVDDQGVPLDLTVRSFGVLRSADTPAVRVEILDDAGPPVNGSDAVFAAVVAATWLHLGTPPVWPTTPGRPT